MSRSLLSKTNWKGLLK